MQAPEDLSTFLLKEKLLAGTALATLLKAWQELSQTGEVKPLHKLAFERGVLDEGKFEALLRERDLKLAVAPSGRAVVYGSGDPGECTICGKPFEEVQLREASPFGGTTLLEPGATLGRYTIVSLLGVGSAGEVYHGRDPMAERDVALKLLRLASDTSAVRFAREGKLLASLQHPHIVGLYDLDMSSEPRYLVMEYVDGKTFDELLEAEHERADALAVVRMASEGVAFAHDKGIIHRDLKPANILLMRDDEQQLVAKVTDFGLAKSDNSDELTIMGEAIGTPSYMAPEQIKGDLDAIGPATDVWALGVLCYRAMTGELPFHERSAAMVFKQILADPFPSARERVPELPRALDELCQKACHKEPGERFPNAGAFVEALNTAQSARARGTIGRMLRSLWRK